MVRFVALVMEKAFEAADDGNGHLDMQEFKDYSAKAVEAFGIDKAYIESRTQNDWDEMFDKIADNGVDDGLITNRELWMQMQEENPEVYGDQAWDALK